MKDFPNEEDYNIYRYGFNPLNQVYVFNTTTYNIFYCKKLQRHFRNVCQQMVVFFDFLFEKSHF